MKKMSLNKIKVESYVTTLDNSTTIRGGYSQSACTPNGVTTDCTYAASYNGEDTDYSNLI